MRAATLLATLTVLPTVAVAEPSPWIEPGAESIGRARSAAVVRADEALFQRPEANAPRRGSAALGARLPIFGAKQGLGCESSWLLVGPSAWVCGDHVRLAGDPPVRARAPSEHYDNGLPFEYYFVGADGSFGYEKLSIAEEGTPDAQLEPGFIVAVVQRAAKNMGDARSADRGAEYFLNTFGLTTKRLWLPMRDLAPARPDTFSGAEIHDHLDVAWVKADAARVYGKPGVTALKDGLAHHTELHIRETKKIQGVEWVNVGDGQWVRRSELNVATPSAVPDGLRPGERWLDVDLSEQVLTAYEGPRPVFATLVSSGKGRGSDPEATPKGVFHIWVKLRTSDMTNLEDEDASRYYSIEEVPWVMFFHEGFALHGAFWHHSFGHVRSHGCVNLAPRDAERLFYWTGPRLPAGWTAALPTETDVGTLVRIR